MNKYLLYLILCFSMACCNQIDSDCEKVMQHADEIMENNQDSATISFSMLDSISCKVMSMPKKQKMRYHLLCAKAMNKAYIDFTNDSVMKDVVEYYDSHGTDEERMMANYLMGCVYRDLKDAPKAFHFFDKAIEYNAQNKKSYLMLNRIHAQKAEILHNQALVEQELKELDKAGHYAMLAGDTVTAIIDVSLKALAFALVNNHDSAIYHNNEASRKFKDLGYTQNVAQISINTIKSYLVTGQIEKAKHDLELYEQQSGHFVNGEIIPGYESYHYLKGLYFVYADEADSAKHHFMKCSSFAKDLNMKIMACRGLSLLYNKIGKADSTAKYAMLTYEMNDSLYQLDAAEALLRQEASYNYERYQEEAKKKSDDIVVMQWWLMGAIVIIICIVGVSVYIHRRIERQNEWKLSQTTERYEMEKRLLQNEMEEMYALLEEKESLLENKDLIFERKRMELDDEIAKKELSISELQDRVTHYEQKLNIKNNAALEDEIQSSQIRAEFEYFTLQVREHPTEKQWRKLVRFAKNNLPQMYILLHKYHVTDRELRICILSRLRFKPGEIATIMDCKFPDISHIRSRLLKRIYGIDGKAADFDKRIMLLY
ncbi:MAG: hypothetical protein MJZ32_00300 [Bacteroidaceae bacterium]|nr:hypothetical protein [Bacteroidaceae bacterium]